jgi:hypothetical protein
MPTCVTQVAAGVSGAGAVPERCAPVTTSLPIRQDAVFAQVRGPHVRLIHTARSDDTPEMTAI